MSSAIYQKNNIEVVTPGGFEPLISTVTGWHVSPLHHGAIPVMNGPVILVDEDTPSDELGNRLQRLVSHFGLTLTDVALQVHSIENINLTDESTIQGLEREVVQTRVK